MAEADDVRAILDGVHAIGDLAEAAALVNGGPTAELLLEGLEPFNAVLTPIVLALNVLHGMNAKYIAYGCAGTSYGLIVGASGQGSTAYPAGGYSIEDDETVQLKQKSWSDGVSDAQSKLGDGQNGVALKNKIMLRIAQNGGSPEPVLQETWVELCKSCDIETPYADQMCLLWPQTGITGKN
jgi:hypothetical protein